MEKELIIIKMGKLFMKEIGIMINQKEMEN